MRNPVTPLMAFLLVGCATGPPYANTQTQDAATLVGTSESIGGETPVWVDAIDGAVAPASPLFLAPGTHHLSVHLENRPMEKMGMSDGQADEQPLEMDVLVKSNESYRLAAYVGDNGGSYLVQLIEQASGSVCAQVRLKRHISGYKSPDGLDPLK